MEPPIMVGGGDYKEILFSEGPLSLAFVDMRRVYSPVQTRISTRFWLHTFQSRPREVG